ncbi:OmpA family protein [Noviherbaspirillum sp. Root189]|uniref:OmpA family protein n=1 Tax=Noviherbaspirillum sp. Root189 TaxID=1736487 RepID=UPI0009EA08C7|nr:OmpA family protein [Noviherbaspirillum sp. Root189]
MESVHAQSTTTTNARSPDLGVAKIVASGAVPDATTKANILARLQQVYGQDRVVDQISIGGVAAPPNWTASVSSLLTPQLMSVHQGQLVVEGTNIAIHGEVASDATRQNIGNSFAGVLNEPYSVKNGLRVSAAGQGTIDQVLGNRVVEFENASALLTVAGKEILDELAETLKTIPTKRIDIVGHTDNVGDAVRNLALSRARADSVKIYLVAKGITPQIMRVSGLGADQPLTDNTTAEGRRRNRRIEFRLSQ